MSMFWKSQVREENTRTRVSLIAICALAIGPNSKHPTDRVPMGVIWSMDAGVD